MIRSMDVDVAVHALSSADEARIDGCHPARLRRMRGRVVALLAETRLRHFQQLLVRGAMRVVAIAAVLHDRWVLPQEWAAFLRVAGEAGLIHGCSNKELVVGGAMRIMAARALHLALTDRHVGEAQLLRGALLMTAGARGEHGFLAQVAAFGHGRHDGVAVRARDRARLVRAALPGKPRGLLVTLEANRIALSDWRLRLLA